MIVSFKLAFVALQTRRYCYRSHRISWRRGSFDSSSSSTDPASRSIKRVSSFVQISWSDLRRTAACIDIRSRRAATKRSDGGITDWREQALFLSMENSAESSQSREAVVGLFSWYFHDRLDPASTFHPIRPIRSTSFPSSSQIYAWTTTGWHSSFAAGQRLGSKSYSSWPSSAVPIDQFRTISDGSTSKGNRSEQSRFRWNRAICSDHLYERVHRSTRIMDEHATLYQWKADQHRSAMPIPTAATIPSVNTKRIRTGTEGTLPRARMERDEGYAWTIVQCSKHHEHRGERTSSHRRVHAHIRRSVYCRHHAGRSKIIWSWSFRVESNRWRQPSSSSRCFTEVLGQWSEFVITVTSVRGNPSHWILAIKSIVWWNHAGCQSERICSIQHWTQHIIDSLFLRAASDASSNQDCLSGRSVLH